MWPEVEDVFLDDLERLHERAGPWDLVCFTGDLTQRGSAEEFAALGEMLERLWAALERMGSRPLLVPVPGNHDLVRPPVSPALRAMRLWHEDAALRDEVFTDPSGPYRRMLAEAFGPYEVWLEGWRARHPLPDGVEEVAGALPGDRLLSVRRGDLDVGIVALNSAFLQLTGGDYLGHLDLDVRQVLDAAGGALGRWTARHHLTMLLTHHPPEWLHPRAQQHLDAHLAPRDRFPLRLHGHMHVPESASVSLGGAPTRRWVQGASLFGLEGYGEGGEAERIHGYSAGRFAPHEGTGLDAPVDAVRLSVWPRLLSRHRIVPDFGHFDLDPDRLCWTDAAPVALGASVPGRSPRRREPTSTPPGLLGMPPGSAYHPALYIPRPAEEARALDALAHPGGAVAISAPELCGKSHFAQHAVAAFDGWTRDSGGAVRVLEVPMGLWDPTTRADPGAVFSELAAALIDAADDSAAATSAWSGPGTPGVRLRRLVRCLLDERVGAVLLLMLEQAEAVVGRAPELPVFNLLRAMLDAGQEPWRRLRVVVTLSTTQLFLDGASPTSSFFNRATWIDLPDLDATQIRALSARMGVRTDAAAHDALVDAVGGHP